MHNYHPTASMTPLRENEPHLSLAAPRQGRGRSPALRWMGHQTHLLTCPPPPGRPAVPWGAYVLVLPGFGHGGREGFARHSVPDCPGAGAREAGHRCCCSPQTPELPSGKSPPPAPRGIRRAAEGSRLQAAPLPGDPPSAPHPHRAPSHLPTFQSPPARLCAAGKETPGPGFAPPCSGEQVRRVPGVVCPGSRIPPSPPQLGEGSGGCPAPSLPAGPAGGEGLAAPGREAADLSTSVAAPGAGRGGGGGALHHSHRSLARCRLGSGWEHDASAGPPRCC